MDLLSLIIIKLCYSGIYIDNNDIAIATLSINESIEELKLLVESLENIGVQAIDDTIPHNSNDINKAILFT